jgi:HNH endonuclease
VKKIKLNKGQFALVDDEDFEIANSSRWHISQYGYAAKSVHWGFDVNHKRIKTLEFLHRLLLSAPKGYDVDHINLNKLDNRKSNLRICKRSGNVQNRSKLVTNTTGYKCIYRDKTRDLWKVQIGANGKLHHIGRFVELSDAISARDRAIKELHGEFARC